MSLVFLFLRHESFLIRDIILQVCELKDTKTRLSAFAASNSWIQAFILRKGLRSVRFHVEARSFDITKVAGKISEPQTTLSYFEEEFIFNTNETGFFFKLFPKRS